MSSRSLSFRPLGSRPLGSRPLGSRSGITLIELVVASMLSSLLMIALFRLLDVALDMWAKGESRRTAVEQASATAELLATDIRALHAGQQGDLLCEWVPFDADGDGHADRAWPRLRLVRQASLADLARVASAEADAALRAQAERLEVDVESLEIDQEYAPPTVRSGLLQVAWAVVPASATPDGRAEGVLMRGEELLEVGSLGAFFDDNFFSTSGQPRGGVLRDVTGGILWLGLQFATQTSIVWDGWELGDELQHTCASWDAWNRTRPDAESHFWNRPGAGMPEVDARPLLPRRVLLEIEFEMPRDRKRRTRTVDALEKETSSFEVENGERLPTAAGRHLLIGGEWMELISVRGDQVQVRRGARGTAAALHPADEMVHFGEPVTLEIPIAGYSDDWRLGSALGAEADQ